MTQIIYEYLVSKQVQEKKLGDVVSLVVKHTLIQVASDYQMDKVKFKEDYLGDSDSTFKVAPPRAPKPREAPIVEPEPEPPLALSKMKKEQLVEACQTMRLSIDGTVPILRQRIKEAGGLPGAKVVNRGKRVKSVSMHTHLLTETSDTCQMCDTYGNELVGGTYIAQAASLRDKLNILLAKHREN